MARFRARAHSSGNVCLCGADIGRLRLSALRLPSYRGGNQTKLGRACVARTDLCFISRRARRRATFPSPLAGEG